MAITKLKLTSPGVLLIFAVVAACGIFLLDLFYLAPHVASQASPALQEEFAGARRTVGVGLGSKVEGLARLGDALSRSAQFASPDAAAGGGHTVDKALSAGRAGLVLLTDGAGRIVRVWSGGAPGAGDEAVAAVLARCGGSAGRGGEGLLALPDRLAMFACRAVPDAGGSGGGMWLCLVRDVDAAMLDEFASAVGGPVVFVPGDGLPAEGNAPEAASQSSWKAGEDHLVGAWMVYGPAGEALGYFRAEMDVSHVHNQALAARRMVLIALSLSLGLAFLVIVGAHMLIGGPVVRLLSRLQEVESGKGRAKDLARHLHGEPLMLARRLESAFEKLAHISKTDELTSLANRRHFEEVLEHFYHQAKSYNRPLSLAVMDVDFFKAVNDSAGHAAGDDLLKLIAQAVEEACRKADLPARLGGDEFAVLFPETSVDDAAIVAERIRQAVCARPVTVKALDLNATISAGITDLNAGEIDSPGAMLALADRALYAAKDHGRNRVVRAHELDGVSWETDSASDKAETLYKKVAGLDTQFKDLVTKAVNEIVDVLSNRDPYLAAHSRKVQHYAVLIAQEMELPDRVLKRLRVAAMLHDVGMLAMPDSILLNPGPLSPEQMAAVRRHPLLGVQIMEKMAVLEQEIPTVRYHHERYDGTGYPEGIAAGAIPLTARILSVADAFDAMTSPSGFRVPRSRAEALEEVKRWSGAQFDPGVVEAFTAVAARMGEDMMAAPGPQRRTVGALRQAFSANAAG